MGSLNKAMIIGNLGADPEVSYTQGGTAVGKLNVATNEKYKNKDGQTVDHTEWHRVTVWGRMAELCKEYLSKGSPLYLEGRLRTNKWTDKNGVGRYTTEINADRIQFLGSGGGKQEQKTDEPPPAPAVQVDDDIPF